MDKLDGIATVGRRAWRAGLATAALAAGLNGACGAAQAGEVYWSLGVQSPGVVLSTGNWAPPVYAVPAPVVVYPQPRMLPPPPPVYQLGWVPPGHRHHHHHWRDDDDWRGGPGFESRGGWRHEGRGHGWR